MDIGKEGKKAWVVCIAIVSALFVSMALFPETAFADAEDQAISEINALVKVAKVIIRCLGVIVTLWGIFELGSALQQHDGAPMTNAAKRILAGLVMLCCNPIINTITAAFD